MPVSRFESLIDGLRAAAEPTRLRLLNIYSRGEFTVSEVQEIVDQSQPRVSRHLKLLCNAGLLERHREQHWVYYRVPQLGDGAELARTLLSAVPADDPLLELDSRRLDAVLNRRAEAARRLVAESGLAEAQLFMAFAYRTGRGVSADDLTAAQWYERAARQGLPEAQFELGFMYELGLGVPMDAEMSAGWYAQATAGEFCPAELPAGGRLGSRHDD